MQQVRAFILVDPGLSWGMYRTEPIQDWTYWAHDLWQPGPTPGVPSISPRNTQWLS